MNAKSNTNLRWGRRTLVAVAAVLAVLVVGVVAASAGLSVSTAVVRGTLTVSITGKGRLVSSPLASTARERAAPVSARAQGCV